MRNHLLAFIAGLLMSIGITYSQMIDPIKVKAFLDVLGNWDPTLLVVMASALITYGIGFALIRKRNKPVFAPKFHLPEKRGVDRPLVVGSVLFGAGWGLVGYCPGPAMAALLAGSLGTLGFVAAMLLGFVLAGKFPLPASTK